MEKNEWNILIIEENLEDLRIVKEYLKRTCLQNLSITQTDDLTKAREMAASDAIDIVLLDLSLLESYTNTTVQLLEPKKLSAPVIVVTALLDEETALQALTHGAQDYVVYGEFDEKMLEETIRCAVIRTKAQQLLRHRLEIYKVPFESNSVPIWAYEFHIDEIITVNEAAIQRYGSNREAFQSIPYQGHFS